MSKLRKFFTSEINLGAQTKEAWKQSSVFKYIQSDKKTLAWKKPEAWPMWKSIIIGQK